MSDTSMKTISLNNTKFKLVCNFFYIKLKGSFHLAMFLFLIKDILISLYFVEIVLHMSSKFQVFARTHLVIINLGSLNF
jgi:hypothetical protein